MSAKTPSPLQPATLALREDGTPWSEAYGDIYHSSDGGLAQAQAVFLRGNLLPQRWAGRQRFVVLETGFGLGLNFLATWASWQADPSRCDTLHYLAAELHPFRREDLALLHARWPELAPFAAELQARWPCLTPGFHRLHLAGGRVVLTLMFGDAHAVLAQLDARVDAFYLDGFSPAVNPALWQRPLFHRLAMLASHDASVATWSVAGEVRRALDESGFVCEKLPGFGAKREMLAGRYAGIARARRDAPRPATHEHPPGRRHAIVVGSGLAGSATANRLAERGWRVTVLERDACPANGASGNHAGVLRPLPSLDDNALGRLTRAGTLYGLAHLQRLDAAGAPPRWARCGALHLARDDAQLEKQRKVVQAHVYPADYLRFVSADEASDIAGCAVVAGGWWLPHAAWVNPPSLCAANLSAWPGIELRLNASVAHLRRVGEEWAACADDGSELARAPVVILANGVDLPVIAQATALPVRSARGQVSLLPAQPDSPPRVIVCRHGYVSPEVDGLRCAGATFSVDDPEPELRSADQLDNLHKLAAMLPGFPMPEGEAGGRVGFRPASPDRLPMVGAVPVDQATDRATPLRAIARHPGLFAMAGFGARGLVWSSLAAEYLASVLNDEPSPIESRLADAIDPARYLLRPPPAQRLTE